MLVGSYLAKALLGKNPLSIKENIALMNKVIYANNSIKSAFDMALYDIASRDAGLPLYQFLGAKIKKPIFTDYTISIDSPSKMATDAIKIKKEGFQFIKVKLGSNPSEDIERIKSIRMAIGNEIPLRIDANQGWDIDGTLLVLNSIKDMNIQHCEEPIPRWQFMDLPLIKKQSPIKIMADESCCDEHDAARLISLNACDLFNAKLGKSGGIFNAKKIFELAEMNNIPIQFGGFLESRLGFTAATHVAMCSDMIRYFDFDTCLMFEENPILGGITYHEHGGIELPDEVGIGATYKEAHLSECKTIVIA
jgi:L-alanine-DL-glutamate epimerase-like enolase superfamily enzyme